MIFRVFRQAIPVPRNNDVNSVDISVEDFGFEDEDVIRVEYNVFPISPSQAEIIGVITVLDEKEKAKIEEHQAMATEQIMGQLMDDDE